MPRLSDKQANVIYRNAHLLDLPYKKERWLLEQAHLTDMEPHDCSDLIGSIWEYIKNKDDQPKAAQAHHDIIEQLVDKYFSEPSSTG